MDDVKRSLWSRMAPALLLAFLAPVLAEILPGATRFASIFVFPIEMAVWGGGAVLIRYAVRRWKLGWPGLTALAVALAVAEECLIQQTSLAPLVIHLKGEVYARAFGVNYVYLLWAIPYEAVFVVLLPTALAELVFPSRREAPWLSRAGLIVTGLLFLAGCRLAWFAWTQIARTKVFHLQAFEPPLAALAVASGVILVLVMLAFAAGPRLARAAKPLAPPSALAIGALAVVWAIFWYGLVLMAFGIAPKTPPALVIVPALLALTAIIALLPGYLADPRWDAARCCALVFGALLGSMLVSFVGFIGSAPADLWFKVGVDVAATVLMAMLGVKIAAVSPTP